jgi:ABC-type bacteriocin/lantibiotic exporter with double-glycine peptidase domain
MDYNQDVLAEALQSKPLLGTDPKKIISLMHQFGLQAYEFRNINIDKLKNLINKRITPLLLIQAWADGNVDYTSTWRNRHYVIACGYTNNEIFFMDPYNLGNYTYLPESDLLKRWHVIDASGDHHYNSGLIIIKDLSQFKYNPFIIKYMP